MPKDKDPKSDLILTLKDIRKSQSIKKLNFSMNKLGKNCIETMIKDLIGDESEQETKLLGRLQELDLSGNQKRPFESKYNIFAKRCNYETKVKRENKNIKLNKTKKTIQEKEDMAKNWKVI
mmetsp:Transcript_1498/g.1310  ORF Transcript_1498/g.1310 Transcript_1498/m.1310 type:complete len:121 (-) Transcript_1498:16-378(-)